MVRTGEVVHEAEGVTDLVGRQLPHPAQHQPLDGRQPLPLVRLAVQGVQRLGERGDLLDALGAEPYPAADDLAGARVGEPLAVRPAAPVAVHPPHGVDAQVIVVEPLGGHFDTVGVLESAPFEGARPPVAALHDGRTYRFGDGRVDGEDDRTAYGSGRGGGIDGFEPVPGLEPHLGAGPRGGAVVVVADAVSAGGGVVAAGGQRRVGQRDEMQMLDHGEGAGCGYDGPERRAGFGATQREQGGQPGAAGAAPGLRQERDARVGVDRVHTLLLLPQQVGHAVEVGERQSGGVHDHGAVPLAQHRRAPHDRGGEGLLARADGGGVTGGQMVFVAQDEQNASCDPAELRDLDLSGLAAVEAEGAGAHSVRQGGGQQEGHVEASDADEKPVFRRVRTQIEKVRGHAGSRCGYRCGHLCRGEIAHAGLASLSESERQMVCPGMVTSAAGVPPGGAPSRFPQLSAGSAGIS